MIKYEEHPLKCPFCKGDIVYTTNDVIYGKIYGNGKIYLCSKCKAYTGVHNNTNIAKGILANKQMRRLKIECHNIFDKLWSNSKERNNLYCKLSKLMGIDRKHCHFGHFDLDELEKAFSILKSGELNEKI